MILCRKRFTPVRPHVGLTKRQEGNLTSYLTSSVMTGLRRIWTEKLGLFQFEPTMWCGFLCVGGGSGEVNFFVLKLVRTCLSTRSWCVCVCVRVCVCVVSVCLKALIHESLCPYGQRMMMQCYFQTDRVSLFPSLPAQVTSTDKLEHAPFQSVQKACQSENVSHHTLLLAHVWTTGVEYIIHTLLSLVGDVTEVNIRKNTAIFLWFLYPLLCQHSNNYDQICYKNVLE